MALRFNKELIWSLINTSVVLLDFECHDLSVRQIYGIYNLTSTPNNSIEGSHSKILPVVYHCFFERRWSSKSQRFLAEFESSALEQRTSLWLQSPPKLNKILNNINKNNINLPFVKVGKFECHFIQMISDKIKKLRINAMRIIFSI